MTKPTPLPHANLRVEWATKEALGEVASGYWIMRIKYSPNCDWFDLSSGPPAWKKDREYQIVKGLNHPDNQSKKKLINWSKMPAGTMTNFGKLLHVVDPFVNSIAIVFDETTCHSKEYRQSDLRIAEQTEFTYWAGGECPLPDGLHIGFVLRDGSTCDVVHASRLCWSHRSGANDCIAYRIIGLADGWTDDPKQAA
jgi:hypothetical protein